MYSRHIDAARTFAISEMTLRHFYCDELNEFVPLLNDMRRQTLFYVFNKNNNNNDYDQNACKPCHLQVIHVFVYCTVFIYVLKFL